MYKSFLFLSALCLSAFSLQAQTEVTVKQALLAGPYPVQSPILADSTDVNGQAFDVKNLLKANLSTERALANAHTVDLTDSLAEKTDRYTLNLLSFYLRSDRYVKGTLSVSGMDHMEVFVEGKNVCTSSELIMEPKRYQVVVKYLTTPQDSVAPKLQATFKSEQTAEVVATTDPERYYHPKLMLDGKNYQAAQLSPSGKYLLVRLYDRQSADKTDYFARLVETATGRVLLEENGFLNQAEWMPQSDLLYYTQKTASGRELITVDPATFAQNSLAKQLPEGYFVFTPDEQTLLFTCEEGGPKENPDFIRVLVPDDRIEGYRNRSFFWRYDLASGLFQRLTFGHLSTYLNDVSADSRYLLYSTSHDDLTKVPFSTQSLYRLDLQTMAVDTLWEKRPFIMQAAFSPDGKQLLVTGTGEAFDNIGLHILPGQQSNHYDYQLFLYDLATQKAQALTKDFNPCVMSAVWSRADGKIYVQTEDEDYQRLYVCDPKSGKMRAIKTTEEVVQSFAVAEKSPMLCYYGQSISNAKRLYAYDLKADKERLLDDLSAEKLKEVTLGEAHDWNFTSADGSRIQGRYYLPPHFDATKKYPMIVYYYGGTSPTNRALEMSFSGHMYAAMGYVVYILNPSGTTGFGQEFAARHVNAWGTRTADEIIEGTQRFCQEHPFVDAKKVGCCGASYGGFMTQYLQTRTDIFAAAVSHAGISALSSYWGEGYWGYGYCSSANTGTYPWNHPAFFTEHSPLFHADKINTPLLLIHGNADTNVPVGESIQMFAALKILGKEVALVQVDGENHGVADYTKRLGWHNSIFAWFAKWLKEEPEWWEALYPTRDL